MYTEVYGQSTSKSQNSEFRSNRLISESSGNMDLRDKIRNSLVPILGIVYNYI